MTPSAPSSSFLLDSIQQKENVFLGQVTSNGNNSNPIANQQYSNGASQSKKQLFTQYLRNIQKNGSNPAVVRSLCQETIEKFSPYSRFTQHSKYIHVWLTLISTYSGESKKQLELIAKMQKSGVGKKSQLFYRAKVRILEAHGLNSYTLKEIYDTFATGLEMCSRDQGSQEDRDMLIDELGDFHFERLPEFISSLQMEDEKNQLKHEKVMYLKPLLGLNLSFEELRAYSPEHLYSVKNGCTLLSPEEIEHIAEIPEDELSDMDDSSHSIALNQSGMMEDEEEEDDEQDEEQTNTQESLTAGVQQGASFNPAPHLSSHMSAIQQGASHAVHQMQEHSQGASSSQPFSLFADDTSHTNGDFSSANQQQYSQQPNHAALMQNIRTSFPAQQQNPHTHVAPEATIHTKEAMLDIGSMFQGPLDDEFDNYFEQKKEQRHIKQQVQSAQSSQQRMPLQLLNDNEDNSLEFSHSFTNGPVPRSSMGGGASGESGTLGNLSFNIREDTQNLTNNFAARRESLLQQQQQQQHSSTGTFHAPSQTAEGGSSSSQTQELPAMHNNAHSQQFKFNVPKAHNPRRFSTVTRSRSKKVSFGGDADGATLSGIGEKLRAEATHHRKSISSSMSIISKNSINSAAPALAQLFRSKSANISANEKLGYHMSIFQILWKYHMQQHEKGESPFKLIHENNLPEQSHLESKIGKVSLVQIDNKEVIVNYCRNYADTLDASVFELDDAQSGLCWVKAQQLSRAVWEFYIMKQVQQRITEESLRQCYLQPQRLVCATNSPRALSYLFTDSPQSYPLSTFIQCSQSNQQVFPEHLVIYLTIELLKVVSKVHALGFTCNQSLSEDHLFLRLRFNKHVLVNWSPQGFPQCGLLLTNFADFTDFSLFFQNGDASGDLISIAKMVHLLLTNCPLPEDPNTRFGHRYQPFKPHMYQSELWQELFNLLLQVNLDSNQKPLEINRSWKHLNRVRKLFEEYLDTKKDKVYKALVNANARVKRWTSEQRRRI